MLCDHCGDCYGLLTDVRVLNALANLLGDPPYPLRLSHMLGTPHRTRSRYATGILGVSEVQPCGLAARSTFCLV